MLEECWHPQLPRRGEAGLMPEGSSHLGSGRDGVRDAGLAFEFCPSFSPETLTGALKKRPLLYSAPHLKESCPTQQEKTRQQKTTGLSEGSPWDRRLV